MNAHPYPKELPCVLTESEVRERTVEQQNLYKEIGKLEDELGEIKKKFKTQIDAKRQRVSDLVDIIIDRKETRQVQVRDVPLTDTKRIHVIRIDTDEIIENRDMTLAERQMSFLSDGPAIKKQRDNDAAEDKAAAKAKDITPPADKPPPALPPAKSDETDEKKTKKHVDQLADKMGEKMGVKKNSKDKGRR